MGVARVGLRPSPPPPELQTNGPPGRWFPNVSNAPPCAGWGPGPMGRVPGKAVLGEAALLGRTHAYLLPGRMNKYSKKACALPSSPTPPPALPVRSAVTGGGGGTVSNTPHFQKPVWCPWNQRAYREGLLRHMGWQIFVCEQISLWFFFPAVFFYHLKYSIFNILKFNTDAYVSPFFLYSNSWLI